MGLLLCGFWEGDRKSAPLIKDALRRDIATVSSGNGSGQAKTESNARLGPALIASVESLKDVREIV